MRTRLPVIAIDGPAASGKGTIAANVARALGMHYLESGALYRVVGLAALESGIDVYDVDALASVTRRMRIEFEDGRVLKDGVDVTDALRNEGVSAAASRVAVHGAVRRALLDQQRAMRRPPGLVAEGRDMGTVVFPDATLKIFLTASAEARAERRLKQLIEKGISVTMESLLRDIRDRDTRDAERAEAPLRPAADAVTLDTTRLSIAEATDAVLSLYQARPGGG
jgi:cytidylate kinase